jgi:uncharacterized glyoxalase superfamily protein PhnB
MAARGSTARKRLAALAPQFLVGDVRASAEWYRDRLGFEIGEYLEEPPAFVILNRDGVRLMLSRAEGSRGGSNRSHKRVAIDAYFWVDGVDALYEEFTRNGANVTLAPTDRFYGLREIEVTDPDGYILVFGEPPPADLG